ncbi:uncharacterized protein LOC135366139 [Ornithodoros turicata]|uniref:uncharacterized protein LOC135366139 n=1 Tax=Ornithodoros turicata TaxID=34597 RepID=UPI003139A167
MEPKVVGVLPLVLCAVYAVAKRHRTFVIQPDNNAVETEVHITAQESVVFVGDPINFTCTTKAKSKPEVAWFMYEQDVTNEAFVQITSSEDPTSAQSGGMSKYISTITITKSLFNYTCIIRCRIRVDGQRVFHLSTPMTITQNTTGQGKHIGEQCNNVLDKCVLEHSTCKLTAASMGTCQCEPEYPVYSNQNEPACLAEAKLGEPCVDSLQCERTENGTHCDEKVCRCKTGFTQEKGKCVGRADSDLCHQSSSCQDTNADCVDGRCVCKPGFVANPNTGACEESGDQEFQVAIIGVTAVAVLLVLSGIVAACYVMNKRKENKSY